MIGVYNYGANLRPRGLQSETHQPSQGPQVRQSERARVSFHRHRRPGQQGRRPRHGHHRPEGVARRAGQFDPRPARHQDHRHRRRRYHPRRQGQVPLRHRPRAHQPPGSADRRVELHRGRCRLHVPRRHANLGADAQLREPQRHDETHGRAGLVVLRRPVRLDDRRAVAGRELPDPLRLRPDGVPAPDRDDEV